MHTRPFSLLKLLSWSTVVLLLIAFNSCKQKQKLISVDPAFSKYIEAYTSGVISKKSIIRIQLASDAGTTHSINETLKEELFDLSPSVNGKAYWVDARTIEFKPEKDLKPNELYEVSFNLGKVMKVPGKFEDFKFNVQIIKPSFSVDEFGLKAANNSKDEMLLTGEINTSDVEESAAIEKLLSASVNGTSTKIKWQHNEINKLHGYTIEGIKRGSKAEKLILEWNGDALNSSVKDGKEIEVPAVGDFKVLNTRAIQDAEEFVLVQFSDAVANNQDLNGMITVSNQEDASYTINGSEVKVYVANRLDGDYTVNINEGVVNAWSKRLPTAFSANVFFENRLPSVKIHGRGTILPNSGGKLVLPFEATNLKSVDVSIIKIYENNVIQFLQSNDLNGENELRRVAKPLVTATLKLDDDKSVNLHKKTRFSLDIDRYIRTEPGAIYRINIGFRPEYSLYTCTTTEADKKEGDEERYVEEYEGNEGQDNDEDETFWNRYDSYYPHGYNWEQKDNPCSKSYFNKERFASRNIIASNIGLTTKRGNNNLLFVAATNIITTEGMGDVELEIMDYQKQIIGKGSTAGDGTVVIDLKRKPYLLIAKKGNEKGYLKLDDGSALPLSRFDVSGAEVKNGIKAFIFGERGVWRPGDSLYLSCMIEDKQNKLPDDHPVEMELYTPTNQLYKKLIQTNAEDGFNVFKTATDQAAPTGNWLCKIKIGGAVFEKKLKIETVMPNRLKIDLNFGNTAFLGKESTTPINLSARWLFGATAQNLKARVDAMLYKTTTTFPRLEAYTFDNPTAYYTTQTKTIFDGALSAEGTTTINPNFDAGAQAPGMLTANLLVKVFEPGGNFSIDNISIPYHPYNTYVGVKAPEGTKPWGYLAAGKTQRFSIVNVNTGGAFIGGANTAAVEIYKIQWKWWWDNTADDLSNFTQDEYNKLLKKEKVQLSNGKGTYDLKIPVGDYGRYLIMVRDSKSGHATGTTFYVDDPFWQTREGNDDPSAAAMLSFTSNKEKYNVGDEVSLTIPSSKGGRALISIENGSSVIKTYWAETQQGQTVFKFKAEKEMTPNVYVNVSLLQPHAQTINDLPIRMYGVIPVMIEDKNTLLKPAIKMADVIRPQQPNSITVSEASGKDMSYVIAIVDEGLLDLTRFKTPDPHKAFYAREALGVKSWDLFDFVIGAWGGDLERILTIGGDNEGDGPSKNRKANRFKPVVQFLGPFTLTGGSKTHSFTLPPYMGSVRAMVIAGGNSAYGFAEKAVSVKKPVMLLPTMPRVLGPAEQIRIPVSVFATENSIRNVTLSLETNPFIEAVGSNSQTISFNGAGEQLVYFDARVKEATGIGKVKLVASSGKERTEYEVEIDVRNPNALITATTDFTLNAGQSLTTSINAIGSGNTNKAVAEISSIPAINLQKRLSYLIQYPHGCIEQITSSVFPQLVLNQLLELDNQKKLEVDRNIRRGIEQIRNFQTSEGGFGYWPGHNESDEWGTNYAGHFLIEASNKGFNVPASMLQQWKWFERSKANAWNQTTPMYYGGDLVQAYRLYLLALANAPELGAMNRLKEYKFITPEAKWRLAAAYHLMGQSGVALKLVSGLPTTFNRRPFAGITYGSELRDQAMVLETLTIMGRRAEAERLVRAVAARLSQESWYSTQTTAYSLIAIANFCGKNANGSKINVSGKVSGENVSINSGAYGAQAGIKFQNGKGNLQLANKGSNVLYVRIINQGQPISGDTMRVNNNTGLLRVTVAFITTSGSPIDVSNIEQGTDFVAKVTVKNTGQQGGYDQMALSQIFPSGWEILNTRLFNSEGAFKSSPAKYMDIRDDRVYHYFDLKENETVTYYVQLNAAYPGRFYWPGVYCEAMYDNRISSRVNGRWVTVVQ
jgi:uncharacterized protein YfaS (alpha-2-macroglobulin family)